MSDPAVIAKIIISKIIISKVIITKRRIGVAVLQITISDRKCLGMLVAGYYSS